MTINIIKAREALKEKELIVTSETGTILKFLINCRDYVNKNYISDKTNLPMEKVSSSLLYLELVGLIESKEHRYKFIPQKEEIKFREFQ